MMGVQGLYNDGWMLSAVPVRGGRGSSSARRSLNPASAYKFELYDVRNDWTQNTDVAAANPAKLREMTALMFAEFAKYQVLPLDASVATRMVLPRPDLARREDLCTPIPAFRSPAFRMARRTANPQHVVHDHCQRRHSPGRRRRRDRDRRWKVGRLRALPAQRQAGVHLEPARPQAVEAVGLGEVAGARRVRAPASIPSSSTSNMTAKASRPYAEARWSEGPADWISVHVNALTAIGGVPKAVVCDNLKAGVTKPSRYEPGINRSYQELATHYGFAVLPTRIKKPRDKAKAEVAVQIVQRFVLARLRDRRFFSLDELNASIRECVADLNARIMRKLGKSRRELLETIERPALKPLPAEPYRYAEWKRARVAPDYHIEIAGHYYSVPSRLIREVVEARITSTTIEIFHRGTRVASHAFSAVRNRHTTIPEHMPSAHRRHAEWTPARLIREAEKIGSATLALVEAIMRAKPHPEQGFRSCLGILRLAKEYGVARLEAACRRGNDIGARSYGSIASILQHGLDRAYAQEKAPKGAPIQHANIRGQGYYH